MPVRFENDEAGYLAWIEGHPSGLVLNTRRWRLDPTYIVMHRASCASISTMYTNYTTTNYVKICGTDEAALSDWARANIGGSPSRCGRCFQ